MSPVRAPASGGLVYAERGGAGEADALWRALAGRLPVAPYRSPAAFIARVRGRAAACEALSGAELAAAARHEGGRLRRDRGDEAALGAVFGVVAAAARASLGVEHYDVQIAAGRALFAGRLVEMATGEGKTLTAVLPAAAAALAGEPVHVVTTNDYLARRDAEAMGPIYARLGLRVGYVVGGLSPAQRQAAYRADVVYCPGKELGFDYLKDSIALRGMRSRSQSRVSALASGQPWGERLLLRGLCFAIVDEADSVLIDEARTPLIISAGKQPARGEGALFVEAVALARGLEHGEHFHSEGEPAEIRLTAAGRARLAQLGGELGGLWRGPRRREALAVQALTALHHFRRDHHYLVREDAIAIIDENTGRVHPDRAWEHGLQQMIEAKEGVTVTAARQVLARISYQRFFRRFQRLAGMTGTAAEVAAECRRVYALPTTRVPTHRPVRRRYLGRRVFADRQAQIGALIARLQALRAEGRPVLVGTRSVETSEALSCALAGAGLAHRVLNARQDSDEAQVVAGAGAAGAVTIATSMAGRGTDIALGAGVAELGGLHVICFEHHDAARVDRQLWGRCARQGDPGSYELLLSLDDELAQRLPAAVRAGLRRLLAGDAGAAIAARALRGAQRRVERSHARARRTVESADEQMDDVLAFAGARR